MPAHFAEDDGAKVCKSTCEEQLAQALGKSELADFWFRIRGIWVASGHRSVLAARSPVFARMFSNHTIEKSGWVDMDDVTVEGLAAFLEFVYLGKTLSLFFFSMYG